jgi:deoxyribose-phosphate aldolase
MTLDERRNRIIAEERGRMHLAPKCNWCWVCPDYKTEVVSHIVRDGAARVGAKIEDIVLMRRVVGEYMGVKVSGGIREYETAVQMIEAGASRIGVSPSVAIVEKRKAA